MRVLVNAVRKGDLAAVRRRLRAGDSPNTVDESCLESVLTIAAKQGRLGIVRVLLDGGADPNFLGTTLWPLIGAAGQGHTRVVKLLLDRGAYVDAVDEDDGTALSHAAAGGHFQVVTLLLAAGANPKHEDSIGQRPLTIAARKRHKRIVELLAPLSDAEDRKQASMILALATRRGRKGEVRKFHEAAERGNLQTVVEYLDSGGDPDAMDSEGSTAAFWAAHKGRVEVLKTLVEYGANMNHVDTRGNFPLVYADSTGQKAAYDYLYPLTDSKLRNNWERRVQKSMNYAKKRYPQYFK